MSFLTNDQISRLRGLEVFEVSLVDRPANLRPWLLVKSAENKMPKTEKPSDETKADEKSPTEKEATPAVEAEVDPDAEAEAVADEAAATVESTKEVAKSGRKISSQRLDRLRAVRTELDAMITEADPPKAEEATEAVADPTAEATEKAKAEPASATSAPSSFEQSITDLTKRVDVVADAVAQLAKAMRTTVVEKAAAATPRPASQSLPAGESGDKSATDNSPWGDLDMNGPQVAEEDRF